MIKLLITDADTLLGSEFLKHFHSLDNYFLYVLSDELSEKDFKNTKIAKIDSFNIKELKQFCYESEADFIINTKIFNDVGLAEKKKKKAWDTNAEFAETLTRICTIMDAKFAGFSSYLVFDGRNNPYEEFDTQNPQSYFARTQLAAENAAKAAHIPFVWMRLGKLLGSDHFNVNKTYDLFSEWNKKLNYDEPLSIPHGYIQPVFAEDVAFLLEKMIENDKMGFFNVAGDEVVTYEKLLNDFIKIHDFKAGKVTFYNNPLLPERIELVNFKVKSLFNFKFASSADTINSIKLKKKDNE